jgi:hypothetical protein
MKQDHIGDTNKMVTALQQLIAWGDEKLKTEPMKHLSFAEVIDKAEALLEVEKEQITEAYDAGLFDGTMDDVKDRMYKKYYNETYNK